MNQTEQNEINALPEKYRPLSAWAYFGYQILFAIPLIGLICLILFSLNNNNINRRSFARSYFCVYIIAVVIVVIAIVAMGGFAAILGNLQ